MSYKINMTTNSLILLIIIIIQCVAGQMWTKSCNRCHCKWTQGSKLTTNYPDQNIYSIMVHDHILRQEKVSFSDNNYFPKLPHQKMANTNRDTQIIRFQNCSIAKVDVGAFDGLAILTELDLSGNDIKLLETGIFRNTLGLRMINLSSNSITVLEDGVFYNLNFLWRIVLNNNNIQKITENTFKKLPALKHIDLSYNQLKTISFDLTDYLPNLNSLDLQGNPWICDCHLEKFKQSSIKKQLLRTRIECYEPLILKGLEWTDTIEFACPPHILESYLDVHVTGKSVTLVCKVSGNPTPNVSWTRHPKFISFDSIENNQKYVVATDILEEITWHNLTIMDVNYGDMGVYKCLATTSNGEDEKHLVLPYATGELIQNNWKNCSYCACLLIGSTKTANCSGRDLDRIPGDLSNEITEIDFSYNFLGKLRQETIVTPNILGIQKMKFQNCAISDIDVATFTNLKKIVELDLSRNEIETLKSGIFKDILGLRIINLSHNKIKELEDGIFFKKKYLEIIILNHNSIEKISERTFKLLPNLTHIDLAYNQLKTILFDPTDYLPKLRSLDLQGNPWKCDCHLQKFKQSAIYKSLLKTLPKCVEPPRLKGFEWSHTIYFPCSPKIVDLNFHPQNTITIADNVTLTCKVKGDPKPDIEWFRNGVALRSELIKNHEKYKIENKEAGMLIKCHIMNVSYNDAGEYSCKAKNQAGEDAKILNLVIISHIGTGETVTGILKNAAILGLFVVIFLIIVLIWIWCFYGIRNGDYRQSGVYRDCEQPFPFVSKGRLSSESSDHPPNNRTPTYNRSQDNHIYEYIN